MESEPMLTSEEKIASTGGLEEDWTHNSLLSFFFANFWIHLDEMEYTARTYKLAKAHAEVSL